MISVIIPTLWIPSDLKELLFRTNRSEAVGEIVLINNDASKTPDYLKELNKVKVLDFGKNIFVNPAWNAGVNESKYDKICLLSDDTLFDEDIFKLVDPKISPSVGTFGPHGLCIIDVIVRSPFMGIVPSDKFWHGYGTCLFVHKQNYLQIPHEFQINYGDRWQYDYNAYQKRQNFFLSEFFVKTKMGTSSSLFKSITDQEESIHRTVYAGLKEHVRPGPFRSIPTVNIGV
jgi:hypothetical protein